MPSNTIEALNQCQKGMRVNLTRLRYFLAVASSGTVTAAAARLHVAQPAISRQLQQLEREVGVVLFEHYGRTLRLTAAGRAFVPLAEEFSVREQHFENAVRDLAAGAVRHLVLAAPETSISEIVAPFIATLTSADPLIRVRRESPGQLLRLHAAWDPAHYAAPLIERLVRRMSAHAAASAWGGPGT
jgi:DNA-binding transcriptional LysR family regulator